MGPDFTGNSLGILSSDAALSAGQILFGGTITTGNIATLTVSGHAPFAYTVLSGDTLYTIVTALSSAITTALGPSITAMLANPSVPQLAICPHRDGSSLPTISVTTTGTLTASVVSQPANHLEAGPVIYGGRVVSGQDPVAGDCVCLEQHTGANTTDNTKSSIAYGWRLTRILDPHLATLKGAVDAGVASNKASNGYVSPTYSYGEGMYLFDEDGGIPSGGYLGFGKWNVPGGYFIDGVDVRRRDCFVATMSAAQSVSAGVITKVNFNTVGANIGNPYDATNAKWCPPVGMVRMSASLLWNVPANSYVFICKNGATLRGSSRGEVSVLDYASGSDFYDCRVLLGSAATLDAQSLYSWFEGQQI